MVSSKLIHIVSCHAEGEVGDVIVGGVPAPPGDTLWEQRTFIAQDQTLRNFVLNEPRGGVFRHVNLLVPAIHPDAQMGWIIMEPEDTPPMSGSNSICVATVLLETGILPMTEPETHLVLEAPGGLVSVRARCKEGHVEAITITNVASFVDQHDVPLEVEGIGTLQVSTAYGGDSFVIVDAARFGFILEADEARDIAEIGMKVSDAANDQLGFTHPENPDWTHISFCQFTGPLERIEDGVSGKNAVAIRPGKIDRCPTGTGCSARMALLYREGILGLGERYLARSIINSEFQCRILKEATLGDRTGVIPQVTGRAWITGTHQLMLDPSDPWPEGVRLSDTWPKLKS